MVLHPGMVQLLVVMDMAKGNDHMGLLAMQVEIMGGEDQLEDVATAEVDGRGEMETILVVEQQARPTG